jgi:hypothetical protein
VLIFNAFPGAAATALFSDAITYRFRVRPVTSASAGAAPIFTVGEEEYTFDFTFTAPSTGDGKDAVVQAGTCNAPSGEKISFRLVDETPAESYGLRIFAGARLDPFFIDLAGVRDMGTTPAGRPAGSRSTPIRQCRRSGIAAERVLARTDPVQQQVDVRAGLPGRQQPVVVLAEGEHDNVLGRLLAVHDDEIELGLPDFQRPNLAQLLGDVLGGDVGCGLGATGSWCAHRLSIWRPTR